MSHAPVRVGLIGLGAIGHRIAKAFAANPETPVTFLCDRDGALAERVAGELGGAAWSTDYRDMLEGDHVDLVYVGVPPRCHRDISEVSPHLFHVILGSFGPVVRAHAHMEYPADPVACETGAHGLPELASGQMVAVDLLCNVPRPETVNLTALGSPASTWAWRSSRCWMPGSGRPSRARGSA